MATPTLWSSVDVDMQSTLGSALTISAITQANPGVATSTAHGLANGAYVVLKDIQGMSELDGRVSRVANVATDTFELEGIDTTNFGTFTSGEAFEITYGTSIATVTDLSASGGEFDFIDVTTIHDSIAKQIPGLASAISYSFTNIWDVTDAGLTAMKAASDVKAERAFLFTFQNGQKMVFNGFVGSTNLPVGTAQALVTTPSTITMFGVPTFYQT